jgi:hypothetical protein
MVLNMIEVVFESISKSVWKTLKGNWRRGANTSLFMSWDFRLAILAPFVVAVTLMVNIADAESIVMAQILTKESINVALEAFRLPLGVLTLAFPLVAMVASNLRSEQAVHQMELQRSQNDFANHYLHLEKFSEQMEDHCNPDGNVSFIKFSFRWQRVHSFFYPLTKKGGLDVPDELTAFMYECMHDVEKSAIEVSKFGDEDSNDKEGVRSRFFKKYTDFIALILRQFGEDASETWAMSDWNSSFNNIAVVFGDVEAGMCFDFSETMTATYKVLNGTNSTWLHHLSMKSDYSELNQYKEKYDDVMRELKTG